MIGALGAKPNINSDNRFRFLLHLVMNDYYGFLFELAKGKAASFIWFCHSSSFRLWPTSSFFMDKIEAISNGETCAVQNFCNENFFLLFSPSFLSLGWKYFYEFSAFVVRITYTVTHEHRLVLSRRNLHPSHTLTKRRRKRTASMFFHPSIRLDNCEPKHTWNSHWNKCIYHLHRLAVDFVWVCCMPMLNVSLHCNNNANLNSTLEWLKLSHFPNVCYKSSADSKEKCTPFIIFLGSMQCCWNTVKWRKGTINIFQSILSLLLFLYQIEWILKREMEIKRERERMRKRNSANLIKTMFLYFDSLCVVGFRNFET